MSAFVVDTETMDRCVSTICARGRYGQIINVFAGIDTERRDARTEIGKQLFSLNIEAVMQRYPDCEDNPGNLPGPCDEDGNSTALRQRDMYCNLGSSRNLQRARQPFLIDGYKALQCLRYQCSEGDIDQKPLYQALSEAIATIAEEIVESLPEYEKAAWG